MKRILPLTTLAGVLSLPLGALHANDSWERSDDAIIQAVENELLFDSSIPAGSIEVSLRDDVLVLSGTVENLLAHDRAAALAETVRGVRAVDNRLKVDLGSARPDAEIRANIESALLLDPATESYEVTPSVEGGIVSLRGKVDSYAESTLAEKIAKSVRGVMAVNNELRIDYQTDRPDSEIAADVRESLRWEALVPENGIHVTVDHGEVTLSGSVSSLAERSRAVADAWVAGVHSVDSDRLLIDPEVIIAVNPEVLEDQAIRAAIESALERDADIDASEITVTVREGEAVLAGLVSRLSESNQAEERARNTAGIHQVVNRIAVRESPLSDEEIQGNIETALQRDPYLSEKAITVKVSRDHVTLSGRVESPFEKTRAAQLAAESRGVQSIENHLETALWTRPLVYDPAIGPYGYSPFLTPLGSAPTEKSDREIRDDIEGELFWSPFVDRDEVEVFVDNGKAVLSGTVDSLAEMDAAVENAYEGGARRVENNLVVAAN